MIPTQSTASCIAAARTLALCADPRAGVAVELGAWLGALTAEMASANHDLEIHCYDRFVVDDARAIPKARRQGVALTLGQDLLPRVRAALPDRVHLHQGEIAQATWCGKPIVLHVDDACKQAGAWSAALRTFSPSWIPGVTALLLLDYHFPRATRQRDWARAHSAHLEQLSEFPAAFRFLGGVVC